MSRNYKDTLNLPRTDFPMKANLAAREPQMLKAWEDSRLYQQTQKAREDRQLFVLHDGPPFANGDVHMGTALNKILKDFVVKSQTMLGKRAPYVPGWDCHGLPIEYKVVKESRKLSPLEVRQKSEAFARKYVDVQREDTAVYVKFPIVSGEFKDKVSIAIWTTTPWTLPANLAIAVDPKEIYVVQEFSRDGASETLLLAEKLVPQFQAATGLAHVGQPLESFPGAKIEKIKARHPFLDRQVIVLTADFIPWIRGLEPYISPPAT